MRRRYAFLALVSIALIAIACSSGKNDSDNASTACHYENYPYTPSFIATPITSVSLEEAQSQVGFHIAVPADLPAGAALDGVRVMRSDLCPEVVQFIALVYRGGDIAFELDETKFDESSRATAESPERGTPVDIAGVRGHLERLPRNGRPPIVAVSWKRGGVSFGAAYQLSGALTEDAFLDILRSIP